MKKQILILSLIITCILPVSGQNDPKANGILDKFSAAATSAPSVSIKFLLITDDQVEKINDTVNGTVILSKNSYRLDLPDNIIWFDGTTSWSYLPAEKEVTITTPDKKDDSFLSKPSTIFTVYKKGYKNRLVEENSEVYIIDLYPEDLKSELIRIRLNITKPSLNLKSFEYRRRDGLTITIVVQEFNLKQVPAAGTFTWAPEKFKGVEVVDMR